MVPRYNAARAGGVWRPAMDAAALRLAAVRSGARRAPCRGRDQRRPVADDVEVRRAPAGRPVVSYRLPASFAAARAAHRAAPPRADAVALASVGASEVAAADL